MAQGHQRRGGAQDQPDLVEQPGPLDQLRDAAGLVEVTAEGLLAQHRHARVGRSADPFEMRSGPGRDHERVAGGRDRGGGVEHLGAVLRGERVGAHPVSVVHRDDPVRFLGQRELQRAIRGR